MQSRHRLQKFAEPAGAASIHTRKEKRDDHLRSPDFLDAALTFRSTRVTSRGKGYASPIKDPWGNVRAAATGKLNRKDWGLTWNQTLEFGALRVGEEVRFRVEVEAVAKTPAAVG